MVLVHVVLGRSKHDSLKSLICYRFGDVLFYNTGK